MNERRRTVFLCPTPVRSHAFAYRNYESLYSTECEDFDVFDVLLLTFCFFPAWGLSTNTVYNMVRAGFYHTGDDLLVKCCACKLIVMRFCEGDDPFGATAHRSNYPIIDKAKLMNDNERLRSVMTCKKCKQTSVETLFLPCHHLVACKECASCMDKRLCYGRGTTRHACQ